MAKKQQWRLTADDLERLLSGGVLILHPRADLEIEIGGHENHIREVLLVASAVTTGERWEREYKALLDVFLEERRKAIEEYHVEVPEMLRKVVGIAVARTREHERTVVTAMRALGIGGGGSPPDTDQGRV